LKSKHYNTAVVSYNCFGVKPTNLTLINGQRTTSRKGWNVTRVLATENEIKIVHGVKKLLFDLRCTCSKERTERVTFFDDFNARGTIGFTGTQNTITSRREFITIYRHVTYPSDIMKYEYIMKISRNGTIRVWYRVWNHIRGPESCALRYLT
jgi:hypothetical protein